jgi:hypothetical protein
MNRATEFDYTNQCWVINGIIQRCGHINDCNCYGKEHEGEAWKSKNPGSNCSATTAGYPVS